MKTDTAQNITSYGRPYIDRTPDGQTYDATTLKKRVDLSCS
ncbi:ribosome small subunit-dependent GTPase A, partial [Neisseria sp. P0017.S007]